MQYINSSKSANKIMRYRFNKFEFDSESLLLTNNGEALPIRHTEAKVLALLLEQADTVLNKEDILSDVWQTKIVSEQVVFQNISHLRNLFGNDAIKTFPKRGYQWQLSTEVISSETQNIAIQHLSFPHHAKNDLDSSQQPSLSQADKKRPIWQFTAIVCIIFIIVSIIYSHNEFEKDNKDSATLDSRIKLAYIPMTNLDVQNKVRYEKIPIEDVTHEGFTHEAISLERISLQDNTDFDFTALTHLDTEQFEDSTAIEYPKLSSTHPFILTGKFRSHKQQSYLDFTVKGPSGDWQGLLSGSSKKDVIEQLHQHLKQQVIYDLISKPQPPELELAKLSIAHQSSPNDLIILRKLSIFYFKIDELEKAMAMTDKLISIAQSQNKLQHIGKALAYQSKILTRKKLYDLSTDKLKLALTHFEKINDLKHQARVWYYQSWLDHQQKNYSAIKTNLLKSAQLAFAAKNKFGEIEALIYLAAMAHNYQNDDDKYLYLQQAEDKMNVYQLPIYHFALISYRYATFAQALSEKEPHLKQVLKLTTLTPEHWAAQSSRRQLVQYYLTQNRFIEAQELIDNVTSDNGNNSYLKTLMAQAKQQTNLMINHAQRTFEQAQLSGNRRLSLDVALLLCNQEVNCDFYSQYINDNASTYWRSTNEIKRFALKP